MSIPKFDAFGFFFRVQNRKNSTYPDPPWLINPKRKAFVDASEAWLKAAESAVLAAGAAGTAALQQRDQKQPTQTSPSSPPPSIPPASSSSPLPVNQKKRKRQKEEMEEKEEKEEKEEEVEGTIRKLQRSSKSLKGQGKIGNIVKALALKKRFKKGHISKETLSNGISDLENQGKAKQTEKAYGGGIVLQPEPGFYTSILEWIYTFDFASLYPSIIEWARICWTLLVCREEDLARNGKDLRISFIQIDEERAVPFVTHIRKKLVPATGGGGQSQEGNVRWSEWEPVPSVMDKVIHLMVQNRKRCRARQKGFRHGSFDWNMLEAEQLTWKVLQNACYGFMGSSTSPFVYKNLGAVVCSLGQHLIKKCRWWTMAKGCRVVYGDTDSIMPQIPLDGGFVPFAVEQAQKLDGQRPVGRADFLAWAALYNFRKALSWETGLTNLFGSPVRMELECIKKYSLFQLGKKKTYVAMEIPASEDAVLRVVGYLVITTAQGSSANAEAAKIGKIGTLIVKGLTFTKRDKCLWVQEWSMKICRAMFGADGTRLQGTQDLVRIYHAAILELETIVQQRQTALLTITCNIADTYKSDACIGPWLKRMNQEVFGRTCMTGDRLSFVYAEEKAQSSPGSGNPASSSGGKGDHKKQFEKAILTEIFDTKRELVFDTTYYLEKQLFLAVEQLMGHNLEFMACAQKMTQAAVTKYRNRRTGQHIPANVLCGGNDSRRRISGHGRTSVFSQK